MVEISYPDALLSPFDLHGLMNKPRPGKRLSADLISFGRPFISNLDIVERFANSWPLNPEADQGVWYSFNEVGYADFPRYKTSEMRNISGLRLTFIIRSVIFEPCRAR
jgi:hypothetical protein